MQNARSIGRISIRAGYLVTTIIVISFVAVAVLPAGQMLSTAARKNGAGDRTRTYDPIITNCLSVLVDRVARRHTAPAQSLQHSGTKRKFLASNLHGVASARHRLYPAPLLIPYRFQFVLLIRQKPVPGRLLAHSLFLHPLHPTPSTATTRLGGVGPLAVRPLWRKGRSLQINPIVGRKTDYRVKETDPLL